MDTKQRRNMLAAEFANRFGGPPALWSRAPGRVDLMGSHTDYNEGFVMTMAIDRDVWIAARPRTDRQVAVYSLNLEGGGAFSLDDIAPSEAAPWTNYVRGVAATLHGQGYPLTGFDGLIHSTIPFGSGLSSSAALEVAVATLFTMLGGKPLPATDLALLCQRAENEFVGVNCGILDQYSSALGQAGSALLLDCRHLTTRTVALPPEAQVVICDTRAKRELTGSEYGQRRAQCEEGTRLLRQIYPAVATLRDVSAEQFARHEAALPDVVAKRCRFIIEESQRVQDLAAAFSGGRTADLQTLTADSYRGARDLYEIASSEMEAMMQAMLSAPGVIGARQAGAGFGGCMVAFVENNAVDSFARHVEQSYAAVTGIEPKVYPVQAAAGAGPLNL